MASGFGLHGGVGRCYPVWMDFSECMANCEQPMDCGKLREDYFECLHHRKEYTRMNMINKERERQMTQKKDAGKEAHHH